jgi:hypothetical protein
MRFVIEYHVKDRLFSAYYMSKKNRIKVCERGRDSRILFDAIKDTIKSLGTDKYHEVIWKRMP